MVFFVIVPAIVTLIITVLAGLFLLGAVSLFIPALGGFLFGLIFLGLAYFIPNADLFKSKQFSLGTTGLFAVFGIGIIVLTLLGINLGSWWASTFGSVMPFVGATQGSVSQGVSSFNAQSFILVFVLTMIGLYAFKKVKK